MERELETSGKMTWAFIWRFILYYIAISIVLAVITYFMLGKANMLVLSIFSIITMGILIFFPTKLATSDLFKTKKMDSINLKKFKRNILGALNILQAGLKYSSLFLSCFVCLAVAYLNELIDRKSTRLNSSHTTVSRMPSSA